MREKELLPQSSVLLGKYTISEKMFAFMNGQIEQDEHVEIADDVSLLDNFCERKSQKLTNKRQILLDKKVILEEIFVSNLFLHNKTITQTPTSISSKTTSRKGVENDFHLWQKLRSTNKKVALSSDNFEKIRILVPETGLEPAPRN